MNKYENTILKTRQIIYFKVPYLHVWGFIFLGSGDI